MARAPEMNNRVRKKAVKPLTVFCVYSLEDYVSVERPLASFSQIFFGISFIASVCKQAVHDVRLFVAVPNPESIQHLLDAIKKDRPRVLALTAVTSQYPLIGRIAARAKAIDSDITGHIGWALCNAQSGSGHQATVL